MYMFGSNFAQIESRKLQSKMVISPKVIHLPVADPGFPRGGGANSGGVYDFAKFSQKLHEI